MSSWTLKQKKYLNVVYESSQRMVKLIRALLNASKIDLGTFTIKPQPTNIPDCAKSILTELMPRIKEKNITLTEQYGEGMTDVYIDAESVKIILQNLLSNAIKYTAEKGSITLTMNYENDTLSIQIKDSGYGIPLAQQDKIFTKLFRADNIKEKYSDGTGLGLYITKGVVDAIKGQIWFKSEENKGTTFFITIPIQKEKSK